MIRALIVDDEPIARRGIRTLLDQEADVVVVGEYSNGRDALEAIPKERPNLIFLDVQMPDLDGFGVLAQLEPEHWPAVVFVTAYDHYALQAFEVNAVDYLLKPFNGERFRESLRRARQALNAKPGRPDKRIRDLLEYLTDTQAENLAGGYLAGRILARDRGRLRLMRKKDIDWVEVRGNYVRLHTGDASLLVRTPLHALEQRLDSRSFLRISRSHIINLDRLTELRTLPNGRYRVVLAGGTELESSRRYGPRIREFFEL